MAGLPGPLREAAERVEVLGEAATEHDATRTLARRDEALCLDRPERRPDRSATCLVVPAELSLGWKLAPCNVIPADDRGPKVGGDAFVKRCCADGRLR
jgi:hypothetical protein